MEGPNRRVTDATKINISSGSELRSMFWSAAGACLVPIAVGLIGLYFCLVPTELGANLYQDYLISLPIMTCFVLGTPIVAWLSCRRLARNASLGQGDVFKVYGIWPSALKYSFYVHAIGFFITLIAFSVLSGEGFLDVFGVGLIWGGIINAVLFVIITSPLSFFCSAIFVGLYSRPKPALAL